MKAQMISEATLAEKESNSRVGDWMTTFSGGRYYPLDPKPEEVFIEDIAHSLSLLCRFNGHIHRFYSVAEHCYLISKALPPEFTLEGLLHDAEEAYTSDIPRPLKHQPQMSLFRDIGNMNSKVIYNKFGLQYPESDMVREYDARIIANESLQLFKKQQTWCVLDPLPDTIIQSWSPQVAEQKYLERFYELYEN